MKKTKKLALLCLLLVVVCVFTIIVKNTNKKKEEIKESGETIIEVNPEDVTSLSWEYDDETYTLYKQDNIWYKENDEAFPIDQDGINDLLEHVKRIGAAFIINDVEDYGQYGLNSPETSVSFVANEEKYTIKLGDYSLMDEERYADIGDGNVYLLSDDLASYFEINYDSLFYYEETPDLTNFNSFVLSGENALNIVRKEDSGLAYSDEYIYFLKQGSTYKYLSNTLVETLVNRLSNKKYMTYASYTNEKEKYGFTNPRIKVKVDYLDEDDNEQEFICYLSNNSDDTENEESYFMIDGSNVIYTVSDSLLDELLVQDYSSLRPTEVLLINNNEISSINIYLDDDKYEITVDNSDDDTIYTYNDKEVDFSNCLDNLQAIEVVEFNEENPSKTKEIKIDITTTKNEKLTLEFYKEDNNYMLFRFNNKTSGYVNRSEVLDLIESINAIVLAKEEIES